MKKKFLSLGLVVLLASCGSSDVRPFVENGEVFDSAKLGAVSQEVKEAKLEEVHGVKITANTTSNTSMSMNGQSSSGSESSKTEETFDFASKKITCVMTSGGKSMRYEISIANDTFSFISDDFTQEEIGYTMTLEGIGQLLEMSFKQLFSWSFIPSGDDIKQMTDALNKMMASLDATFSFTGVEEMITNMANDFVMAGNYEAGNFEVGFDKSHTYSFGMNYSMYGQDLGTSNISVSYSKMRMVFKDYLCRESYSCMTEAFDLNFGSAEYAMNMRITADTHAVYSYF